MTKKILLLHRVTKTKFLDSALRERGSLGRDEMRNAKIDFHRIYNGWQRGLQQSGWTVMMIDNVSYVPPELMAGLCPKIYLRLVKNLQRNKRIYIPLRLIDKAFHSLHIMFSLLLFKPRLLLFHYDALDPIAVRICRLLNIKMISYFGTLPELQTEKVRFNIKKKYDHIISGYNLPELWPGIEKKFARIVIGPSEESRYAQETKEPRKKNIDICSIGGYGGGIFEQRASILESLIPEAERKGWNLQIYGYDMGEDDLGEKYPLLSNRLLGPVYGDKFYHTMQSALLMINIPSDKHIAVGSARPQGMLEAAAAQTCQLVYETQEAVELFEPGVEIIPFEDSDQLLEVIDCYLKNKEKTDDVAKNAFTRFKKEYTAEKQITSLVQKLSL